MSLKKKFVLTSLTVMVTGALIGVVLLFSSGSLILKNNLDSEPVWQPRTISEIYEPFDSIKTDLNDYIWPTDITNIMTSAFGEFRSTHFHAGIDISTRGQIGASVFASRDGYIEQIGVSPFGYGKYILMRHKDGYATLYAHLDRFDESIEDRVYDYQNLVGQYSVTMNFGPGEFPYKQGEIIGRSGSTGSGPPHIHFEIRDTNNNPLNPKLGKQINIINDTMPPIFNRLAAIPVNVQSFVNDRITPITVAAIAIRPGEYVVENPIKASGKIGLAVDVHDRNNDTWYRHGIYAMEFFLEDSVLYSLYYDRIPIEQRHQIRLHYDHHLLTTGRGRFRKLFIEEGNALPLYSQRTHGSGIIDTGDFPPGIYNFRIVAYDIAGNTSTLSGKIELTVSPLQIPIEQNPDITNKPQRLISDTRLNIETEVIRDMLLVNITHPEFVDASQPLIVRNRNNNLTIPVHYRRGLMHQYRVQLQSQSESTLLFQYLYNDTVYTHTETIYSIRPDKTGEIHIDNGNLIISYDYGSVYYPIHFMVSRIENDGDYYYSFSSTSLVLDEGIRFSIKTPDALEPFNRSIVYTRTGARWNTHGSTRVYENKTLTGFSRRLFNDIKTAVDTTAPSISNVIVDGNRNMRLRFRLNDDETGIDHSSLKIKLNDELIIGRYDPDLSMVIYRSRKPLPPGTYDLSITVGDRAGNTTSYNRTLTIR